IVMHGELHEDALGRTFLQPIAAPSILGLYGFCGATCMVAAYMAGWYGGGNTPAYLAPFAATFGGLAQFTAGMWAFQARDGIAALSMHCMWVSFWIACGLVYFLFSVGVLAALGGAAPALAAFGKLLGSDVNVIVAGYFLVVSAFIAWWTASGLMFMSVGKHFMPIGLAPGARRAPDVNVGRGEP